MRHVKEKYESAKKQVLAVTVALLPLMVLFAHALAAERRHPGGAPDLTQKAAPSIQALAVKGDTVYAGSFGSGVFRSDNRGASWSRANTGLGDPFVLSLAVTDDGTVYAGTLGGGVYRSRDGGQVWKAVNTGLKRLEVKALLVQGGVLYAGTGDGVYRLSDDGNTWTVLTKGLDDVLVHTMVVSTDRTMFVGTSGKGVLRCNLRETSKAAWRRLEKGLVDHEGLKENFIRVLALDKEQALYAGTFNGGVFRSGDGGETWKLISRALPNDSIRGIVATERGVFVATGRGVYKSENHGGTWTPMNRGLTELSVQVLVTDRDGTLYAGTNAGAFRSDDNGNSWVEISEGLEGSAVQSPFQQFFK